MPNRSDSTSMTLSNSGAESRQVARDMQLNLRIPGPTPLPPEVLESVAKQMINHRGPEYAQLQAEVLSTLKQFYVTEGDVLLFSGSGTGGLEAAVVNTLSPGDRVLAVCIGAFGDRFASIAEAHSAQVERLNVPWGRAARVEQVTAALDGGVFRAVLITCNETSTGVMNEIPGLAAAVARCEPRPLLLVDAISALGAVELPMDALGIDVLITGSQKAWMAPPGITMLGVSAAAWEAQRTARMPRFYWDFEQQRRAQSKGQDAWTPAVTTMFALQTALRMMAAEGSAAIVERHLRLSQRTQAGLERLGFGLFAEEGYRSRTVTAATPPPGVQAKALIDRLQADYGVVVAGGQGKLAGGLIRVGHMGWVTEVHIDSALEAIARCL